MTLINYSEFNTLTDCEWKWKYAYLLGQEEEGAKRGLHLGTLCHLWHGRWLVGKGATLPLTWNDDINTGGKPGEVRCLSLTDFEPELVERALWLAGRFEKHYGSQPPSHWNVISAEQWIARDFSWGTLVGRTDGFVEIDGKLWLIEVKSYRSRPGPLAYAMVSPQLGCYSLLAEETFGVRPYGILYQGILTYQWARKPMTQKDIIAHLEADPLVRFHSQADLKSAAKELQRREDYLQPERDPADSFEQLEVELGTAHLKTAQQYLRSALKRRTDIQHHPNQAIPNVGAHCSWCGFRDQCWNALGDVEPLEIEVELEDEPAEPV